MGHVIIGLGPSGRGILNSVKRRILEVLVTEKRCMDENVSYLYVDSAGNSNQFYRRWRCEIHEHPSGHVPYEKVILTEERDMLENVIDKFVCNMAVNQNDGISFHICLGADDAVGTDVLFITIKQIHQSMAATGSHAFGVYLYLFVPDANSVYLCDFFRKNGYSILQKTNAVTVNRNIEPETGVMTEFIEGGMQEPLKRVYLFSDINESDRFFHWSDLAAAAGEFLSTRITGHIMREAFIRERLECYGRTPEYDENGAVVRSRMFSTFGIKRIIYPESEIRDYAVMSCLAMTVRKLLYNNWIENYGFDSLTDEQAESGYVRDDVLHPCRIEKFMLDDYHLTLQESFDGFCESEKWEKFPMNWESFCDCKSTEIMESEKNNHLWVQLLDDACRTEYDSQFRGRGVRQFYADMREHDALNTLSRTICSNIESILFHEWKSDMIGNECSMSLKKIRITLGWLIDYVSNSIVKYRDGQHVLLKNREACSCERDMLRRSISGTGWLHDVLFGTRKKYFVQYACMVADEYVYATTIESYVYAQSLLETILVRLKEIKNSVVACENYLGYILSYAEKKAQNVFTHDKTKVVDKVYDPHLLHEVVDRIMRCDRKIQELSSVIIFDKLYNKTSLYDSVFQDICRVLSPGDAIKKLSLCIFELVKEYLIEIGENNYSYQLLNVSVLDQIMKNYNSDDLLDKYIREIVADAGVLLKFDNAELGRIPAEKFYEPMACCVQLRLPRRCEKTGGRELLIRKIQKQIPFFSADRDIIDNHNNSEIVIASIKTPFPLRYVQTIGSLRST